MIEYDKFRTGYTFFDIRQILKIESKRKYEKGEYMFITRATVLGRWHEIKLKMYRDYEILEEKYNYIPIEFKDGFLI